MMMIIVCMCVRVRFRRVCVYVCESEIGEGGKGETVRGMKGKREGGRGG